MRERRDARRSKPCPPPASASAANNSAANGDGGVPRVKPWQMCAHMSESERAEYYMYFFRVEKCDAFDKHNCGNIYPYDCHFYHLRRNRRRNPLAHGGGRFAYSAKLCDHESVEDCPKHEACKYAHALQREDVFHPSMYKTRMCPSQIDPETGFCSTRGALCTNAHSKVELRKPSQSAPTRLRFRGHQMVERLRKLQQGATLDPPPPSRVCNQDHHSHGRRPGASGGAAVAISSRAQHTLPSHAAPAPVTGGASTQASLVARGAHAADVSAITRAMQQTSLNGGAPVASQSDAAARGWIEAVAGNAKKAPSFGADDWPSLTPSQTVPSDQRHHASRAARAHAEPLSAAQVAHDDATRSLRKHARSNTPSSSLSDSPTHGNNRTTQSILESLSRQNAAAAAAAAEVIEQQQRAAAAAAASAALAAATSGSLSPPQDMASQAELRSGMDILRATSAAAAASASAASSSAAADAPSSRSSSATFTAYSSSRGDLNPPLSSSKRYSSSDSLFSLAEDQAATVAQLSQRNLRAFDRATDDAEAKGFGFDDAGSSLWHSPPPFSRPLSHEHVNGGGNAPRAISPYSVSSDTDREEFSLFGDTFPSDIGLPQHRGGQRSHSHRPSYGSSTTTTSTALTPDSTTTHNSSAVSVYSGAESSATRTTAASLYGRTASFASLAHSASVTSLPHVAAVSAAAENPSRSSTPISDLELDIAGNQKRFSACGVAHKARRTGQSECLPAPARVEFPSKKDHAACTVLDSCTFFLPSELLAPQRPLDIIDDTSELAPQKHTRDEQRERPAVALPRRTASATSLRAAAAQEHRLECDDANAQYLSSSDVAQAESPEARTKKTAAAFHSYRSQSQSMVDPQRERGAFHATAPTGALPATVSVPRDLSRYGSEDRRDDVAHSGSGNGSGMHYVRSAPDFAAMQSRAASHHYQQATTTAAGSLRRKHARVSSQQHYADAHYALHYAHAHYDNLPLEYGSGSEYPASSRSHVRSGGATTNNGSSSGHISHSNAHHMYSTHQHYAHSHAHRTRAGAGGYPRHSAGGFSHHQAAPLEAAALW